MDIAAEQLTHPAFRQLILGQSAILDLPAEDAALRERWASIAKAAGATFSAILCHCQDAAMHEARFGSRTRGIPGWHETGNWAIVAQHRAPFIPWTGADVLAVDASTSIDDNMEFVRTFVVGEPVATGRPGIGRRRMSISEAEVQLGGGDPADGRRFREQQLVRDVDAEQPVSTEPAYRRLRGGNGVAGGRGVAPYGRNRAARWNVLGKRPSRAPFPRRSRDHQPP